MTHALSFSYPFDLSSVSRAGSEEAFEVPEAACQVIAETYEVDGIEDFTARFRLTRLSKNEYALEGHFAVTILQTCIVTLKPLHTVAEQDFKRRYDIAPHHAARREVSSANVELESEDRETLHGTSLDLVRPLLEELSLAIDPYPRIPGAALERSSKEQSAEESPFAVLRALKDKLEPPEKT
jgi:uncharacterized metal-binding protein YceD (DUF177 family)